MPINTEYRKSKIKKFITFLKENKDDIAIQELDEILEVIIEEQKELTPKSELRELIIEMREGFKSMDRRFQDILHYMDKRFNAIDKRFDEQLHYMNKRFESIDKRFEEQLLYMNKQLESVDKRFEEQLHYMDKRFDAIDKRFEEQLHYMNKRFESIDKKFEEQLHYMDKRFEELHKKINFYHWFLTSFIAVIFGLISFFQYNNLQNNQNNLKTTQEMIQILKSIESKLDKK
ncbi:MAG: hypothetical protein KatS3mg129_1579 [Leptospiraceae bacterium]|nr:MAG: hypothetical protein KatS3mg129_1579 [Leptospiraceae bacterium]